MKTVEEIKSHLEHGDYTKIAKVVGIKRNYAIQLMDRPGAKLHSAVVDAARKVATANMKLGL